MRAIIRFLGYVSLFIFIVAVVIVTGHFMDLWDATQLWGTVEEKAAPILGIIGVGVGGGVTGKIVQVVLANFKNDYLTQIDVLRSQSASFEQKVDAANEVTNAAVEAIYQVYNMNKQTLEYQRITVLKNLASPLFPEELKDEWRQWLNDTDQMIAGFNQVKEKIIIKIREIAPVVRDVVSKARDRL